ncbi:MAG: hypothetical protein ACRDKE_00155 [Solirubrobacterales bacterium]
MAIQSTTRALGPLLSVVLLLAAMCQVAGAAAKTGTALPIDPVFNGGQPMQVTLPSGEAIEYANDVAAIASGRVIVISGDHLIAFNPDGTRASEFGVGGVQDVDLSKSIPKSKGGHGFQMEALESTTDGGFVVLGVGNSLVRVAFPVVAKFDANGRLDATFGKNGYAVLKHNGGETTDDGSVQSHRLAIARSGEIAVASEEWLKPENGLIVSVMSPAGKVRKTYGHRGSAWIGYKRELGWTNEIGAVTFDPKGRILVTGYIGTLESCDPDLCIPTYEGQPIQFVARLDRQGNLDHTFSRDGYAEPKKATLGCPTIGLKVTSRGTIYLANQCGYVVRLGSSGNQDASFRGRARFQYPPSEAPPVGDELLHLDKSGKVSLSGWSKLDPRKELVSLVLQQVKPNGVDRTSASMRNLSANKFDDPSGAIGRSFVLDYDAADNPLLASTRLDPTTGKPTVYLARFTR